jgi:RNA polymerase sigma-70 factor (subfamily 1)
VDLPEVEELAALARAGDRDAQGILVERFGDRLRSWIRFRIGRRLGRVFGIDDLFQETCIRAFQLFGRLEWRGEEAFLGWLQSIAEHAIRDEVKRITAKRRTPEREVRLRERGTGSSGRPGSLEGLLRSWGTTASKALRREERFDRLERALGSLSPEHRDVLLLAGVRGLPMKEVAERMGRSVEAVSSLHLRALRKLKAAYGKIDSTESIRLPPDRTLDRGEERRDGR